ncbi:hypothetical protein FRC02_010311 [Tulasnella sp. 418]|nr:hypothetical protein FRC02_010311 [Tulasnella sp. 418]
MKLADLPVEIFLDHLLPLLDLPSLLALTRTSKFFSEICSDQVLWQRKLKGDYNFSANSHHGRTSGFKLIYRGIRKPRVFVWGSAGEGRLGLPQDKLPPRRWIGVPYPVELKVNARIVALVAGGWSFHALDDTGALHVWGTLHGDGYPMRTGGYAIAMRMASAPIKLQLSACIETISCGRRHSGALDSLHRVWIFTRWGRPNLLISNLLTRTVGQTTTHIATQVECGWGFVSILTDEGNVFVTWPFSGDFAAEEKEKNAVLDSQGGREANETNGVVTCTPVRIAAPPLLLPDLPTNLPNLENDITAGHPATPRLIKIAAGDNFIIGLTDQGHVLSIDITGDHDEPDGLETLRRKFMTRERQWVYLPQYSELSQVRDDPVFGDGNGSIPPPTSLKITHISAHLLSFVAYSSGASSNVLMGKKQEVDQVLDFPRTIHPSLQNREIISVQLGDYHFVALTADGTVLTWGAYAEGALGLGNPLELEPGAPGGFASEQDKNLARMTGGARPPGVEQPCPVRFDWKSKGQLFCYSIAAAGWHCGALLIDLDPNSHEEQESSPKQEQQPQTQFTPGSGPPYPLRFRPFDLPTTRQPHAPFVPSLRGAPFHRVGFAGRGALSRAHLPHGDHGAADGEQSHQGGGNQLPDA